MDSDAVPVLVVEVNQRPVLFIEINPPASLLYDSRSR
jgi:hypothetical protein